MQNLRMITRFITSPHSEVITMETEMETAAETVVGMAAEMVAGKTAVDPGY
jgi:hypothetical protein